MSTFNEGIAEMRGAVKEILSIIGKALKLDVALAWRDRLLERWLP